MKQAWPHLRQVLSFVLVGASSTGLYFLLLWALRGSIPSTFALTACCYGVSMIYNYILQSWLTFRAGPPTRRSMSRFVIMHLTAMAMNSLLMAGLVDGLHLPLYQTQIGVTLFISAMIFIVSKRWVYQS
ncbi:GtrA family protein [Paracoccus lutimaris]|uniref:Putative flippase GtrA n=1 Tax=Paracoccus lutimaris TaxID=1490030 RepID=A0A368YLG4_9RHOB|nr:GtrA family protein [Paracoccus lutimaris]RCW81072.1 putative flippase GtrA [Paracoccus lutimaris]